MESYVIALAPVLFASFLGILGWLVTRMVRLSEIMATCGEKVNAINVEQRSLDERLDALVLSRWAN